MNQLRKTMMCCKRTNDSGQVVVIVLLVLGIFLVTASAFGVDYANFWFHRQAAQGAADAACTAGVMDMLTNATEGASYGGFPGGDFDCSSSPGAAPCQYAGLNGYNGDGLTPGNTVLVSFVATSSIPGIDPNSIPGVASNAIQIDIIERVSTFFSGLLTGNRTQQIRVRARCAVLKASAPVPLTILNRTCDGALTTVGNGDVTVIGGPPQSIQINSNNASAATVSGSSTVDLSHGGPSFSGSYLGIFGGPLSAPGGFSGAGWVASTPMPDPWRNVPKPTNPMTSQPATIPSTYHDAYGCPDPAGCTVYPPGRYTKGFEIKDKTALFVPGLYYFDVASSSDFVQANCGDPRSCISKPTGQCNYAIAATSNSAVRMALNTAPGSDGGRGATFYLSGPGGVNGYGSVFLGSNSGSRAIDAFNTTDATNGVKCPGGPDPDPGLGLPTNVNGNVLMGPCTYDGSYTLSPTNVATTENPSAIARGLLFFQDRNNGNNDGQPSMQGGGGLLLVGTMYFHHCPSVNPNPAVPDSTICNPATEYKAFYELLGNTGSGTFLLGNITTDRLVVGGSSAVKMQLDSHNIISILKASLVQ